MFELLRNGKLDLMDEEKERHEEGQFAPEEMPDEEDEDAHGATFFFGPVYECECVSMKYTLTAYAACFVCD